MLAQASRGKRTPRTAPRSTVHQLPPGCAAVLQPAGYNRLLCELTTPSGAFTGSGWGEYAAVRNALVLARNAGAIQ